MNDPRIAALLQERAGYVRDGKPDRVKQVDDYLRSLGHREKPARKEAAVEVAPEAAVEAKPSLRRPRGSTR